MQRQTLGKWGESQAADYLQSHGLRIICRNYRCPLGEIDIIARDSDCLVFCEVKTRSSKEYGLPQEAVAWTKQHKIAKVASWYLGNQEVTMDIRFDVVAITKSPTGKPEIEWLPAAFSLD
ncbi:MAG: YraN family protein [Pseudomonadota bacterium]|nr:YraN family protein [Pseudomonadota bacterium]